MSKKYFFLLWMLMISLSINAQVFTRVNTGLHGVMDPVMGWLNIKNQHLAAFVAGDYYTKNQHVVISQLTGTYNGRRFAMQHSPFPALYRGDAAVGDYNHDGFPDIVMTGLNAKGRPVMRLYRNDGHGRFTYVPQSFIPLTDGSVEWGDYDHDGDLDLLVTGKRIDNKLVTLIYRNDNGHFTQVPTDIPGVYNGVARWGDINNDGRMDILITGNNGDGPFTAVYVYKKGKYQRMNDHFVQLQNSDAQWADFNKDGYMDFIISGEDKDGFPDCRIYSYGKNGHFTDIPVGIRPLKSCSIDVADYNHDGYPDIVMTGESTERPYTDVYKNESDFHFQHILTDIPGVSNGKALWGDFDHDGDMDLLVAGITVCYHFIARIYRNNLNPKVETVQKSPFIRPIPVYRPGPYYYYVFSSCFCDPTGGNHPRYHMYISNIHRGKTPYYLNYKFNDLLIKMVPNWGKTDRGHRTSNAFTNKKQAELSRTQVIESYKASGFKVHYIHW